MEGAVDQASMLLLQPPPPADFHVTPPPLSEAPCTSGSRPRSPPPTSASVYVTDPCPCQDHDRHLDELARGTLSSSVGPYDCDGCVSGALGTQGSGGAVCEYPPENVRHDRLGACLWCVALHESTRVYAHTHTHTHTHTHRWVGKRILKTIDSHTGQTMQVESVTESSACAGTGPLSATRMYISIYNHPCAPTHTYTHAYTCTSRCLATRMGPASTQLHVSLTCACVSLTWNIPAVLSRRVSSACAGTAPAPCRPSRISSAFGPCAPLCFCWCSLRVPFDNPVHVHIR